MKNFSKKIITVRPTSSRSRKESICLHWITVNKVHVFVCCVINKDIYCGHNKVLTTLSILYPAQTVGRLTRYRLCLVKTFLNLTIFIDTPLFRLLFVVSTVGCYHRLVNHRPTENNISWLHLVSALTSRKKVLSVRMDTHSNVNTYYSTSTRSPPLYLAKYLFIFKYRLYIR